MLVWRENEDGVLEAEAGDVRATLREEGDQWVGELYLGTARLSVTRGASDTAVVSTLTKRIALVPEVVGACEHCGGPMLPFRETSIVRCLTRDCDRFKKKG